METYLNREQTEAQRKASVLIEALPYIQKFNRKIVVIKYGGSAMDKEELQRNVIKDVTLLKLVGFKPIIVHGGGKAISKWVEKSGKEAQFINGLRVTDEETMEIAEMVLGRVNKDLVRMVEELGVLSETEAYNNALRVLRKAYLNRCYIEHSQRAESLARAGDSAYVAELNQAQKIKSEMEELQFE